MAFSRGDDPRIHLGVAVRKYRLERGFSQERLAQLAGIHRNYAGAVERGERNVAIVNLVRIARALGISVSKLLEGVDVPHERSSARAARMKPPASGKPRF